MSGTTRTQINLPQLFASAMIVVALFLSPVGTGAGFAKFLKVPKYSAPKTLPSPKAIRSRPNVTSQPVPIRQQVLNRAQTSLSITPGAARARLRSSMTLNQKFNPAGKLSNWNAHHMVYLEYRSHPAIAKAAKAGYDINGMRNGIRIPRGSHQQIHAAFDNTNKHNKVQIEALLNRLNNSAYSPELTASLLRNQSRRWKYDVIGKDPLLRTFNPEIPYRAYDSVAVKTNLRLAK